MVDPETWASEKAHEIERQTKSWEARISGKMRELERERQKLSLVSELHAEHDNLKCDLLAAEVLQIVIM